MHLQIIHLSTKLFSVYQSFIRVGVLCVYPSVGLDVVEGIVHQASHATHVAIVAGAVNQLLLAQRHQLPSLPEVLTLQRASLKKIQGHLKSGNSPALPKQRLPTYFCTYCTEGPAGATLLLILDISDVSLFPPVNSVWQLDAFRQAEESRATARKGSVEGAQAAFGNQAFVLFVVLVKRDKTVT